jgi:hypothetical protein
MEYAGIAGGITKVTDRRRAAVAAWSRILIAGARSDALGKNCTQTLISFYLAAAHPHATADLGQHGKARLPPSPAISALRCDRLLQRHRGWRGDNWSAIFAPCRKTKDWSCEKEWRLVFPLPYIRETAKVGISLKSITIDLRTPLDHQRRLTEIAQKLNLPLYRPSQRPQTLNCFLSQSNFPCDHAARSSSPNAEATAADS